MVAVVRTLDGFAMTLGGLVVASEVVGAAEEDSAATRKDLDASMEELVASLPRRFVSYVFFGLCLFLQWSSSEALLASSSSLRPYCVDSASSLDFPVLHLARAPDLHLLQGWNL